MRAAIARQGFQDPAISCSWSGLGQAGRRLTRCTAAAKAEEG
jgi:hypothetical protein